MFKKDIRQVQNIAAVMDCTSVSEMSRASKSVTLLVKSLRTAQIGIHEEEVRHSRISIIQDVG